MKKILILFVLFSCMVAYGEDSNSRFEKIIQEFKTSNASSIDWRPYMQELEQTLKGNWHPPKNNNSKRTVINFIVAKDGNFNNLRIIKSSGIEQVDEAALNAVQKSAPFKPLPKEYNGEYVPIEFVFDYNVIYAWSSDVKDRCKTKFCKFMQKY